MDRGYKGSLAEKIALKELTFNGYEIVETNFTCKIGEIDIIAIDNQELVFIEVRSKKDSNYGLPQETIDRTKKEKIRKVALFYLKNKNKNDFNCRFDVVSIIFEPKIMVEIIKDAF